MRMQFIVIANHGFEIQRIDVDQTWDTDDDSLCTHFCFLKNFNKESCNDLAIVAKHNYSLSQDIHSAHLDDL